MASIGRQNQRGNQRIDAALDAMRPYGFPEKLVRQTVKELLQVYGGSSGWVFVEDASYMLLIETLLEKQQDGAIERIEQDKGRGGSITETLPAGPSSGLIEATSSNQQIVVSPFQADGTVGPPLSTDDSERRDWKDINLDQNSGKKPVDTNVTVNSIEVSEGGKYLLKSSLVSPKRRRKPCYGWISSDDDEDLMDLTPAPFSEELAKLLLSAHGLRKRKRWDLKPDDM